MHAVFFIEDKEDINEDMLIDFKDIEEDDVKVRYKKSESLGGKKLAALDQPKAINLERNKDRITKEDLLFGGKKKALVNINDDDDFPDLEGDPFDQKAVKRINGPKVVAKKQAPSTTGWGYNEEPVTKIGGNNVVLANNKARPQTAAVVKNTVDIRKQQDLEKKTLADRKIREANMELQDAKMALMAFDSKPTLTKKQQK